MSAPKRIHALPLQLANQIAAGEVIERPASVVKELVENSLDAGASQLVITIEGAGSQLISVRDNGSGIHPEDLPLALSRHATSKISSSDDLSQISSLGFRGEALPSIGSVAQLTLISRQADSECGWQLRGDDPKVSPLAHPYGTTVTVRDLFFNLPARRRFLRSPKTEQQHLTTTLNRLALSRFDIAVSYQLNGQQKLALPIADTDKLRQQRVARICGNSFAKNAFWIQQQHDLLALEGWLAPIDAHRPNTDVQYFFINGRVVRDRLINLAVRQAFVDNLPAGRHPAYILYLTLPLDRVDVNVHPTKHEVRFQEARLIHGLISRIIRDALKQQAPRQTLTSATDNQKVSESTVQYQQSFPVQTKATTADPRHPAQQIALLAQRYLLIRYQDLHWLLDLTAADSHLRKQQLLQAANDNTLTQRPVLVPINMPVTSDLAAKIRIHLAVLSQFAIVVELRDKSLLLRAIPAQLYGVSLADLLQKIMTLSSSDNVNPKTLLKALLDLLPEQQIFDENAAHRLLQQVLYSDWQSASWSQQLDKTCLRDLFSEMKNS